MRILPSCTLCAIRYTHPLSSPIRPGAAPHALARQLSYAIATQFLSSSVRAQWQLNGTGSARVIPIDQVKVKQDAGARGLATGVLRQSGEQLRAATHTASPKPSAVMAEGMPIIRMDLASSR